MSPRPGEERRAAILRAAVSVFAERGYGGASLREVAAACGMEKGHLSYYFPTKGDLLFEIVNDLHDRFGDGLPDWTTGDAAVERLQSALAGHVRTVCLHREQTLVSYESFRFLGDVRRQLIVGKRRAYEDAVRKLVADYLDDVGGEKLLVPVATKAVLGMVNWPYQWYSPKGPLSVDELATSLAVLAINAMVSSDAPGLTAGHNMQGALP